MRSRLEAQWAAEFDSRGDAWDYEPCCFADESGQYLPDFRLHRADLTIYLEVRGYPCDPAASRRRMEIIWASDPTALLIYWHVDDPDHPWFGYPATRSWVQA